MIGNILKNMNLFVDGRGFAGKVDEITLPKLTLKTEEHRAGGMDAPVELDMGMEKLECEFTLSSFDVETLKLFGLASGSSIPLTVRGATEGPDGTVAAIAVNLRGKIREIDHGTWKPGDKATTKYAVALKYYKLTVDGSEIHEIDVDNMIRKIDGIDQLAEIRKAIGV